MNYASKCSFPACVEMIFLMGHSSVIKGYNNRKKLKNTDGVIYYLSENDHLILVTIGHKFPLDLNFHDIKHSRFVTPFVCKKLFRLCMLVKRKLFRLLSDERENSVANFVSSASRWTN